jgi:ethanolamine kinase
MTDRDYHELALSFVKLNLQAWSEATKDNTSIAVLTGNSNKVFLLETTLDVYPSSLIYRYFGPNEITDKSRERLIFSKFALEGLGPKSLADSNTERLEQYLEGYAPMTNAHLTDPAIIIKIAKRLRKVHSLDMTTLLANEGLMIDENPKKWRNLIINKINSLSDHDHINEIMELVSQETLDMYNEVLPRNSPIVYSHLDPSLLNFLYNPDKQKVCFVDYEFSGYAYRSMDFGLLITEMQIDYFYDKPPFYKYCPEFAPTDELIKKYVIAYGESEEMWAEVKQTVIASHYYWSMWALAVYQGPTNGYDYLTYCLLRFSLFKDEYNRFKMQGGVEGIKAASKKVFNRC